uniref:Uncharacterized protein n=1 Tax=Acrobeloides nanus TaxID=290746 RepID=A0A914CHP5_9BILA
MVYRRVLNSDWPNQLPVIHALQKPGDIVFVPSDGDRGFDTRYDNRAPTQPPPLNASTEEELIVRSDLLPQSFGAFSAPSTAECGYFERATAEVKVAGMKKLMNGPPNLRPNAPRTQPQNSGPDRRDRIMINQLSSLHGFQTSSLKNRIKWTEERIQSQPFQAPSKLGQFEEAPQVFTQNLDRDHRTPTKIEAKSEVKWTIETLEETPSQEDQEIVKLMRNWENLQIRDETDGVEMQEYLKDDFYGPTQENSSSNLEDFISRDSEELYEDCSREYLEE